ncbi:DUF814 domain-containing protein [Helicobacter muridarum]|uniref:DUF814 domain-containing protein n=1 Tax=Helicobacter muridarum TaxID=216 RepID=A0A099TXD5_9HELI|nr:DUF814 domain-containing protein [Helicobacter muridarum]TLE00636.1 DUF814 domain-containing protein [Helicobacter muridarum]STQ85654.1 fibronectin/fibrinogen-binding protein [Helicobacter muridarum]
MQLQSLYNLAYIFSTYKYINHIERVSDNIIEMRLDAALYCIDLNKSNPCIYFRESSFKTKSYHAPFDIALRKYCHKSRIVSCRLDGMNKILIFECNIKNAYKQQRIFLHFELINRASNAIIVCDGIIISALRFSSLSRIIAPKIALTPMPQPSFTKQLFLEDRELFLRKLQQHYQNLQDSLVVQNKNRLLQRLHIKLNKLQVLYDSLPKVSELESSREELVMLANHILMNLDDIPPYVTRIRINDKIYEIPQESKASLVSQKLFKQAKKLKQRILHINLQKQNLESKIEFLQNQICFANNASLEEIEVLKQKRVKKTKEAKKYFESFYINGICVSIGRNETENLRLLQQAKGDFLWLHVKNVPSSHLIIHSVKVDSDTLMRAGMLLAKLCGINDKSVVIDFTKRKFVRILQGANVVYSKEKTICIHLNNI